ncbi:pentapeptide repeat-containing protein [Geodermatophilus poikilotrophus]|uniref:Uncharacterized protein YjbI, contains pentapeptide repeats n=1 Tax=Geodermatophilus poikilotrophus TaxID=1333667 RepID=A0A1I0IPE8_9ACTN|nr:pentapeptide repeat-containing protein [Geodermatophilus poikilotrophus]SET98304.1 Uncharacterized protein YjbI, contains pentapeptide repeats [Geodermatophilus poikilotrophus]
MLSITGAAMLPGGFVWLWWQGVPALYRTAGSGPDAGNVRLNAVTTTRAALLAGFVGLGALGTFWLNSRVYRITARTFELTERGHLTDRYTKAIEQLGNDNLDVRLGGIYALEQIAHDSRRDRDQATIVEVLSAFVRVHSRALEQKSASRLEPASSEQAKQRLKDDVQQDELEPPVDVQAAVTVLGRLPVRSGVQRADLTRTNLTRVNLVKANLSGARLGEADLTGAFLDGANLSGANLLQAKLTRAFLAQADLTGAHLYGVDLTLARLHKANLPKVIRQGARLHLANLTGANLTNARLGELGAMFWGPADLTEADLDGVDLTGADLDGVNLTRAGLYRADLTGAKHLTQEQVDNAYGDEFTQLPVGLRPPKRWER